METLDSQDSLPPSTGAGPAVGESCAKKTGVEVDEAMAGVSSKLFRCACVKQWLPLIYRDELYHVLRLTGPLVSREELKCWWGEGVEVLVKCPNYALMHW